MDQYKVLKEFEFQKGESVLLLKERSVVIGSEIFTEEEIASYVADGTLEAVDDGLKVYDGPMGNYRITGFAEYTDEKGENKVELEIGSIQNLPKMIGYGLVLDGVAEEVLENTGATTNAPADDSSVTSTEPKKTLEEKEIISETLREVNGKNYHHVKLTDGTSQDLTDEEYSLKVKIEKNG